jgi:hypothetical protein
MGDDIPLRSVDPHYGSGKAIGIPMPPTSKKQREGFEYSRNEGLTVGIEKETKIDIIGNVISLDEEVAKYLLSTFERTGHYALEGPPQASISLVRYYGESDHYIQYVEKLHASDSGRFKRKDVLTTEAYNGFAIKTSKETYGPFERLATKMPQNAILPNERYVGEARRGDIKFAIRSATNPEPRVLIISCDAHTIYHGDHYHGMVQVEVEYGGRYGAGIDPQSIPFSIADAANCIMGAYRSHRYLQAKPSTLSKFDWVSAFEERCQ